MRKNKITTKHKATASTATAIKRGRGHPRGVPNKRSVLDNLILLDGNVYKLPDLIAQVVDMLNKRGGYASLVGVARKNPELFWSKIVPHIIPKRVDVTDRSLEDIIKLLDTRAGLQTGTAVAPWSVTGTSVNAVRSDPAIRIDGDTDRPDYTSVAMSDTNTD